MARWTLDGLSDGAIYAVEGIAAVFKNPNIRQQRFIKIFIYLSVISFIFIGLTNVLVTIPFTLYKVFLWIFGNETKANQADEALDSANNIIREAVKALPLFAILLMQHVYPKPLDDLFMETLRYTDTLHPERPPYHPALVHLRPKKRYWAEMKDYIKRTWIKLRLGSIVVLLSLLPVVGKFVFPAAGAYTTYKALGKTQGIAVGICFCFLPRWSVVRLSRALISMRSLMRELLTPYFARMQMTHRERRRWFSGRKDVLWGFSFIAYVIVNLPIVGFIGYGIAQAASAYMLTVVTDPPSAEMIEEKSKSRARKLVTEAIPNKNGKLN
ncbi:hypothetical protein BDF20DRAFT_906672 [Mycotypha africana]|uniref:uncharacterized protein n=1 Tax=Mycotypha africana TaxID=64632 RepID=UPI002300C568|nr:uncharacterized protein BDF20DRAFT_906672 [Mycotypha africana]KAI8975257.1 hypothetical protein BDF20DRAFT_906672 [Mycotypha africana]